MKLYEWQGVTYKNNPPNPLYTSDGRSISPVDDETFTKEGGIITENSDPTPEEEFSNACVYFRMICGKIAEFINIPGWRGGYDEIPQFDFSPAVEANPTQALLLSTRLKWCDDQCKRLGEKLGYTGSKWWWKCWELGEQEAAVASEE